MERRSFFFGWAVGLGTTAAAGAAVAAFALLGGFNVSASRQHAAPVARLLHATMTSNVETRAAKVRAPARFEASQVLAGARLYETHCLSCHGAPGTARARWASALVPTPPYLIDAASRWSPAQLYTIIDGGVRMTAMPAWGEVRSPADVWSLVALLEAMPKLTPGQFAQLRRSATAQARPAWPHH